MPFPAGRTGPNPDHAPHPIGTKYVRSALKRVARARPQLLDEACTKLMEDAAGLTIVKRLSVTKDGEVEEYEEPLHPRDRRMALEAVRDTMDGRPEQSQPNESGASRQTIIINAAAGADIAFPLEIDRALRLELEQGPTEPVDLDDPVPHNGQELDEDQDE